MEREREKEGLSVPLDEGSRLKGLSCDGDGGEDVSGGVAAVTFKSKGRRGFGRRIGGPSDGIAKVIQEELDGLSNERTV
jgi:hypothetical protein